MTWNHPGLAQRALDDGDRQIAALKAENELLRSKAERLLKCWESAQIDHQPMIECLVDLREALAAPRS